MTTVNMAVNFGGIHMKNPVNTASGTFGAGWQFSEMMDVSALGAITTKGCSDTPWEGNPAPRMAEVPGGMLNSVGLQNPGVSAFAKESGPWLSSLAQKGTAVICQVAGHSTSEYVHALELFCQLCPWAAGFEINISCPNIDAGGAAAGSTPRAAAAVMSACRRVTTRPLIVKMAPTRVPEIARALEEAGADGLTITNTIPGMSIDIETHRSRLCKPTGGLSGPLIHPIAVRMVWEASQVVDIPICGVGGIMTGNDAAEFILAGATCVAVGMASFVEPAAATRVLNELTCWAERQNVSDIHELIGAFTC